MARRPRHNPEKKTWKGRSYKKGGMRPKLMREASKFKTDYK